MKTLTRRLAKLEAKLPPPLSPELQRRHEQCDLLFDRWDRLGAAAWPLMTTRKSKSASTRESSNCT